MGGAYRGRGEPPTLSLPSPTPPVRPLSFRQAFILTESLPPHPLEPLSLQRRISWRTGFSALEHFKTELFHFPCIPLIFFLSAEPNSRRAASPPVESLRKGGGRGRKRLLQKGLPPPVSLLHLTSTRHLPSPYAAQANDILLISLGPLDGGRHDAEALKAETLLAKQQHFIHRLLA